MFDEIVTREAQRIIAECAEPYAHRWDKDEDLSSGGRKQRKRDVDFWAGFFQGPHFYVSRNLCNPGTQFVILKHVDMTSDYDEFVRLKSTPGYLNSAGQMFTDPVESGVYDIKTQFAEICDAHRSRMGHSDSYYVSTELDVFVCRRGAVFSGSPYFGYRPEALFKAFYRALVPYISTAAIAKREEGRMAYNRAHLVGIADQLHGEIAERRQKLDEYHKTLMATTADFDATAKVLRRKTAEECALFDEAMKRLEYVEDEIKDLNKKHNV